LTAVLKDAPQAAADQVYARVKAEYLRRYDLVVGAPFGFNNSFAMLIRGEDARRLHLQTLSQASAYAPQWRAGFGYEFMERPDGYKGLARTYGLRFAEPPRIMTLGLLNRALQQKQVDLIAGNNTDGLIPALDLFVLQDDRHYFPPYEAVPIMREEMLKAHPEIADAVQALGGKLSDADMRRLNYAVDGEHRDAAQVVREFRQKNGL
jgi:osmoprotectant transport system substrate-binding protein